MKVLVELDIDKERLLQTSDEKNFNQALMNEMGWVEQSGIFLSKIIERKEIINK